MTGGRPPAVILGGSFNAVSVARSLTRAGVGVVALGGAMSPLRHSRCRREFVDLGTGTGVQQRWLEWLEGASQDAVLLPCDDDGLELIARNRRPLVELGYRPFEADDDVVLAMLDKDRTYELARGIGVRAPHTATIRTEADLAATIDDVEYPCALKPVHSHVFARSVGPSRKAYTISDRGELERQLSELIPLGIEMLITEIVPGAEDQFVGYYTYVDERGEPLFDLTKRKLRQYPPVFGMGCYHVTTASDPEVIDAGRRFVGGVGVRGLANVEFKRDARDGRLTLIECNHRFTAIHELLRIAGADLGELVYNRLTGRPLPTLNGFRAGVRLWHPGQDTRAAAALHSRGELTLGEWARSVAHRQHTPLFDWRDPKPTLAFSLARVARRLRQGAAAG